MSIRVVASAERADAVTSSSTIPVRLGSWRIAGQLAAVAALVVLYWHEIAIHLVGRWLNEPDYGHGILVPFFSAYLLYRNRSALPPVRVGTGAVVAGAALLMVGGLMLASAAFGLRLLGPLSILPSIGGLVLVLRGLPTFRWALPSIAFLFFMIPLPGDVGSMLRGPLQRVATIASTFVLQTFGVPAVSIGNVINLTNGSIGIVEACSGLRMLMVFFTLASAYVLLSRHPLIIKLTIVASAIPIAVVANVFRIVTTGMVHEWIGPETADRVFHDFAGLLMVPVGIALLVCFVALLDRVVVVSEATPAPLVPSAGQPKR